MRDISMTGVGIVSSKAFPVGSILHVKILYNEPGKSYEVYGKVMWVREKAMGLKFVKVDPGSLHVGH
jgi:PilZ domain